MTSSTIRQHVRLLRQLRNFWRNWRVTLAFVALFIFFRSAVADWYEVPTGSMQPTVLIGDRVFVNRLSYDIRLPFTDIVLESHGAPERGDVVVFFSPENGERLLKRVIGLPGDTVAIRNDVLFINNEPLAYERSGNFKGAAIQGKLVLDAEQYAESLPGRPHAVLRIPEYSLPRNFGPVTVSDGEYFMLGDNRNNSRDSRYFGSVPRDLIVGRVSRVFWSLDTRKGIELRGGRLLQPLQ